MLALCSYPDENYGMAINWHVGDVLKKLREEHNLTQGQVAQRAGIRPATISAIEASGGHNPETLSKIAKTLGLSVAEIHALVPGWETKTSSREGAGSCPDADPTHVQFHGMLEKILHGGDLKSIHTVVAVLEVGSRDYESASADGFSSDKKHGPFPPIAKPTRKHA